MGGSEVAPPGTPEMPAPPVRPPSARALGWGIQIFIALSIAAILVSGHWKAPLDFDALRSHFDWRFALLLVPLVALDYVLGGLRYRILFNGRLLTRVSLWDCMRSNWGNIFMGAATPFQTGGGPAQIYLLWRAGARVSEGLLASLVNFAGTLVFFVAASLVALLLIPAELFGPMVMGLIRTAFLVVGLVAAAVLTVMILPGHSLRLLIRVNDALFLRLPFLRRSRERLLARFSTGVERFSSGAATIWKRGRWELALVVLLTLVLFSNKFTIGYAIVRALGHDVPYDIFLGLSCVQLFLIYFAPTPGAAGVAELSSVWLMERIIPRELLLLYTVLWRFLTTVLGAVIGGFVLLADMRRQGRAPASPRTHRVFR
ncbi:MAG: lysylphosphatidylglycerol synthase transmembrane domain-containing protein [Candidatus Eisenbacteria bacterium]